MKSQLYLYPKLREKYIKDITQIKELFFERIQPVFAGPEKEAEEYKKKLWEDMMSTPCSDGEDIHDPSQFAEVIEELALDRYTILALMHYRNISMWISCMCQVWEQQLFSFIIHEARTDGIRYDKNDLKKGFSFSREVFKCHQQSFESLNSWKKSKN